MSNSPTENTPESFAEDIPVPSPESEHEIGSPQVSFHQTAESELFDDKQDDIKTIESQDSDITEDEQANTKRSRELKSLLALSKEANLDVNISHKRKSLDIVKLKELASPSPKPPNETEPQIKKTKIDKFPITAESEIEGMTGESSITVDPLSADKGKKDEGVMGEERKNIKDIKVFKPNKDMYCWRCHREGVNISCETCPRSYHQKCLKQTISDVDNWPCPECVAILKAESTQTRSTAMKGMTLEHLCGLLKFAVKRMIQCNGSEPFNNAVNEKQFPEYKNYIIQPMNLKSLEKNIKENLYGSTQAFEADAKWILHNSIIFNSYQSKLTTSAKGIMKICKQEMAEIENCPSCYLNANTKKSTWFVEVCPKPHILVWAKLKGFPYWPAKAMCTNNSGMVDVRFFGAHDRAWVPSKECFLYSRRDPNSNKQKRNDIIECMREVEVYIANIKALYGEFNYAPFKMQYDPDDELKQLLLFIPRYKPNAPPPKRRFKSLEPKVKAKKEGSEEKEEMEEKDEDESSVAEAKEVLEGYGTDDETMEDLDNTKRNMLLQEGCNAESSIEKEESNSSDSEDEQDGEESVEPEMDDDTQLPSNIPEDKPQRGIVRTRGGLSISPGKLKTLPRRTSEESISKRRLSPDDLSPPSKIARRNSDQSIKSDSSRLSSISDKINRVDISENVELTLGNTSDSYITSSTVDLETRKKPVQVKVDNMELSIAAQSKTKISDRLIQKLSSSDEDISDCKEDKKESDFTRSTEIIVKNYKDSVKNKGREFSNAETSTSSGTSSVPKDIADLKEDEEESDANTQTHIILEKYKDLVKKKSMEFSNAEASTSFGTTSVVSKEVCESSDEVSDKPSEEVDKPNENIEIPNTNGESSVDNKDDISEMDISSTENIVNTVNEVEFETIMDPEKATEEHISSPKEKQSVENEYVCDITEGEVDPKKDKPILLESIETDVEEDKEKDAILPDVLRANNKEETLKRAEKEKITTGISEKATVTDPLLVENTGKRDVAGTGNELIKEDIVKPKTEKPASQKNIEKAKLTPGIQVKNKTIVRDKTENTKPMQLCSKIETAQKVMMGKKTEVTSEFAAMARMEGKKMITYSRKDRKSTEMKKKEESAIIEQPVDSNSSDDQGLVLDDTQIDETNIRNIIHSSLNNVSQKAITANSGGKPTKRKYSSIPPQEASVKKIKVNKEEKQIPKKESSFKIVPIQHILNKKIDEDSPERSVVNSNPILLKKLSQPRGLGFESSQNSQSLECVEIKSEPESEEDLQESQYMEAKRQYMSALNISEKTEEVITPKKNEIRTRSKTEEMGKGKQMDNLSRVIEEVATTFSAKHETQKKIIEKKTNNQPAASSHVPEERRKALSQENGEIYVKSFAKMSQQPLQPMRAPQRTQPMQKSKPGTSAMNKAPMLVRREVPARLNTVEPPPQTTVTKITSTPVSSSATSNTINTPSSSNNKTLESLSSSGNVLILTQPGVILPTSQQLTYNTGSFVTFVPSQQNMTMMQTPQVINAMMAPTIHQTENGQPSLPNLELSRSQNYIPQNEEHTIETASRSSNPPPLVSANGATTNHIQSRDIPCLIPITESESNTTQTTSTNVIEARTESTDDEFSLLHSMVPESISKAISEVLCRPPPKLKPKPPGPLSQVFDSGNPSSAGPVSAKINSISHRVGDYFRGLVVEMLEDLGKINTPEATIASLKHEIETLQQKHSSEMMDIRKNVCTILKDIQGSIVEERERLVDETRSACEVEALRRIEEAKSKQWCANCGKEAQFYCCWNTSYCDYSCQIKQWSKHMSKCTQHAGQSQPAPSPAIRPQNQLTFRPANSKGFSGRLVAKPTKVYLNRSANSKAMPGFKTAQGAHLTLVDSSNLEFLANSPGTKFIATSSLFTRVRNVNSTVTSPSNGTRHVESPSQRVKVSQAVVRPSPSTSNNVSNVISDEEMESD